MNRLFGHSGFRIIIPLIDLIIVYLSIYLCFYLFKDNLDNFTGNYYAFLAISPYIGIVYIIASHIFELDKPKYFSFIGVTYTITLVVAVVFFTSMAISFLAREFAYPRSILVTSSLFQILFLSIWHWFTNKIYRRVNKKKTVLIIGCQRAKDLLYNLLESNGMWSNVKHICEPQNQKMYEYIDKCDVTFVTEDVDEKTREEIIRYCVEKNHTVIYEPRNSEIMLFNGRVLQIDDSPVLSIRELKIQPGEEVLKRILDVFLASIGAIIFIIPAIFVYLALKISGGSAFYVQIRVTRNEKLFKMYKFRTMVENAEAKSGPVLAQESDKRITRLGNFLRNTRLDEVPQIFNILKGDMSIVGPRPERPFFVKQFSEEIPEYYLRHRVKAGLTGLAQVQGRYNTSVKDKLKYDLIYINGYSFALDLKLIMQTLNILLRRSSAQGVKNKKNISEEMEKIIKSQ